MAESSRHERALALAAVLAVAAVGAFLARGRGDPAASRAPLSLVVLVSDALRAASLPFHGYPRPNAPRLQALAAESVLFENHRANFPGTPVSVSQLLTGRLFPPLMMGTGYSAAPVRAVTEDVFSLPRELRRAGWRTGLVSSHPWFDDTARILADFDFVAVLPGAPGEGYAPLERLLPAIELFLERQQSGPGAPFFLYVHSMDTHSPNRVHPDQAGWEPPFPGYTEAMAAYDSEILYTDEWVGRIVDGLGERGLLERTAVVFTSDHGEDLGELGGERWNLFHGFTLRQSQLHVPLLVRVPGPDAPRGVRHPGLTRHIDLAPTLYRLADPTGAPLRHRVDGLDLSPLLRGGANVETALPRESLAHSWRYWSLVRDGEEVAVEYDQWEDVTSRFRYRQDAWNYPRPERLGEDPGQAPALEAVSRARAAFVAGKPEPIGTSSLPLGLPTFVTGQAHRPPTYDPDPADQRWWLNVYQRLEAGPGESPPPLALSMPWSPGRYRLGLRLDTRREGYAHELTLRLPGARAVRVRGRDADAGGVIAAGSFEIGAELALEFSEPRGGVALRGLVLTREGADGGLVDPELEERLRALGYVE